jgi:hypothetical protein
MHGFKKLIIFDDFLCVVTITGKVNPDYDENETGRDRT